MKDFYGDEYQDTIFKEAVKCTDSELSLKILEQEHEEIVNKVLAIELGKQEKQQKKDTVSKFRTSPDRYIR